MRAFFLATFFVTAACSEPAQDDELPTDSDSGADGYLLATDFAAELDRSIGCTDTWIQVWHVDSESALEIYVAGLAAEAGSSTASRTVDLSDPGQDRISAVVATPIADNYCTDGLVEREVHETWSAVSGSMLISVDASSTTADPTAAVVLTDVVFELDGAQRTVANATFSSISLLTAWGG